MSITILENDIYKNDNYRILHLKFIQNNKEKISLLRNGKNLSSISLPVSDIEVKNFSVAQIKETDNGFKLLVNWGGGNYFYERQFFFVYKDEEFYLSSIQGKKYVQTSEEEKCLRLN